MSDGDFADLTRAAVWELPDPDGQMMEALIHCLGEEGLRLGEALELEWWDLEIDHDTVTLGSRNADGSRGRGRTIRLFPGTKARLLALPPHESNRVFTTAEGRPLGRTSFYRRWGRIANRWERGREQDHWVHAEEGGLSVHQLRHRAAAWLITPRPVGGGLSAVEVAVHLGVNPRIYSQVFHHRSR